MSSRHWVARVEDLLAQAPALPRAEVVERMAAIAFEVPESEVLPWLAERAAATGEPRPLAPLYLQYLTDNETAESHRLLAAARTGARFLDVASAKGRAGYERVAEMFAHVDFSCCRRLVMVGCGPLPVTALHVAERCGVPECVLLDTSAPALADCAALVQAFGWQALHPCLADGAAFDYGSAQVVYVANVVSPKAATLARVASTAPAGVQLVVREPWSLGRLWSEVGEPAAQALGFETVAHGPPSRHLSRDVILRRPR